MAMMTASELLDWLGKNLFLPAPQVDELRAALSAWPDAHALAKELIRRTWLSPYQVNQILQDKGATLIVGPNRLLERLGEGSMGQVFKAWNTRLGRTVAVKMIHKELLASAKALDRFYREMQTAAQLHHPNIVLVLNADESDGRPFLVMEFVVAENLSWLVKRKGPLPMNEAVEYIRQAAVGLQHAFERNVIHRDIKPGNLLLTKSPDEKPLVKIMDFGLARLDGEVPKPGRLTQVGKILGTIDYIAPEQAEDSRTADIRADIYGLGCSLFFLLAAKPPFPGSTVVEKVLARQENEPPSIRAERPETPAGLDAVLRRMMARKPEHRYQTPREVAQALAPFTRITQGEIQTLQLPQADLAAALTARQLAQAIPVTQPGQASAPVARAWIVAEPMEGHAGPHALPTLAMAQPVGSPHTALGNPGTTNPWGGSTRPEEMPTVARTGDVAAPVSDAAAERRRRLLVWVGGCGAALLLAVIVLIFMRRGPETPPPAKTGYFNPGAALQIMPLEPITFKEGDSKILIVQVARKEFSGPVNVRFEDLPDGVRSSEIKIDAKKDVAEIRLTVSYGAGAMKRNVRLVAVAENLRDETIVPLTVTRNRNVPGDE